MDSSFMKLLLQHYIEYLLPPYSWATTAIIITFGCIYLTLEARPQESDILGCHRLGIHVGVSNIRSELPRSEDESPRVAGLCIYPVKSCRGIELQKSRVTATGLEYDRLFAFAELVGGEDGGQWKVLTQRECPMLARVRTEIWVPSENGDKKGTSNPDQSSWSKNGGCLIIYCPLDSKDKEQSLASTETVTIKIPIAPTAEHFKAKRYTEENLSIWKDCPPSINITNELDPDTLTKLQHFLDLSNPIGLFRSANASLRHITRSLPKEEPWSLKHFRIGFADAFPIHLISLASIDALNNDLPPTSSLRHALDPLRFRANIYISGVSPYDEDTWMKIRIGPDAQAEYHIACRTARCIMTNVHQETGVVDRREPHGTLKRTRQVDEGAKPHPCLGLSVMPLFVEWCVEVGDRVFVDRRGVHVYEKMFA